MSKNESPTRISRFLPGSTPTLTGMLCRGYLPPGKHSRTPTSRRHESGHNSFILERFNSVLLSSQILYSFFLNSCQTRRRSALRYSPHASGFAKTSKKAVAPQKRDFPISWLFVLLTKGPIGCPVQQEEQESRVSTSLKDLKLIFSQTPGSFSSCTLKAEWEHIQPSEVLLLLHHLGFHGSAAPDYLNWRHSSCVQPSFINCFTEQHVSKLRPLEATTLSSYSMGWSCKFALLKDQHKLLMPVLLSETIIL